MGRTYSNRLFALLIRTRSSIALWKIYIEYELREGNHDRAKVVFYRAIRECPWAKGMFLKNVIFQNEQKNSCRSFLNLGCIVSFNLVKPKKKKILIIIFSSISDLYLMAFDVLYHEMNEQELHQILSSVMEKELRIRTAAEAFMED